MTRMQRLEDAARLAMGDVQAGDPVPAPARRRFALPSAGAILLAVAAATLVATYLV